MGKTSVEIFCEQMKLDPGVILDAISQDIEQIKGPQGSIKSITPLTRGASNRGYLRVSVETGNGSITSMVSMVLADPDPHKGVEEVADYTDIKELPFANVLAHLHACGVNVPELYYYNVPQGLLYMEDLGDVSLRQVITGKPENVMRRWFERAIDELVKLQVEATRRDNPEFMGFSMRLDRALLRWELDHFTEFAIQGRYDDSPAPEQVKVMDRCFNDIVEEMRESHYMVQHRDYHMDNLMIQGDTIKVIDFQDAFMGPFTYDLACLLYDRDTSTILGHELIEQLIEYYAARFEELDGKPLDRDAYHRIFDLCVLHRMLKVVGRFYFIQVVKKRDDFLHFIPHMLPAIKRYLDKYPEFADLKSVIVKYIPEVE